MWNGYLRWISSWFAWRLELRDWRKIVWRFCEIRSLYIQKCLVVCAGDSKVEYFQFFFSSSSSSTYFHFLFRRPEIEFLSYPFFRDFFGIRSFFLLVPLHNSRPSQLQWQWLAKLFVLIPIRVKQIIESDL